MTELPESTAPDFGTLTTEHAGMVLSCKAIAPGLALQDLVQIFDQAANEADPGDELAGNPSLWPVTRGVKAVTLAVVAAMQKVNPHA
jgi:hypothetical protein